MRGLGWGWFGITRWGGGCWGDVDHFVASSPFLLFSKFLQRSIETPCKIVEGPAAAVGPHQPLNPLVFDPVFGGFNVFLVVTDPNRRLKDIA